MDMYMDLIRVGVDSRFIFFILNLDQYLDVIDNGWIMIRCENILLLISMCIRRLILEY